MHHPPTRAKHQLRKLRFGQRPPDKASARSGKTPMDAFAFEFMGLVMIALCLVVLAVPSGRRPSKHVRYH